MNFKEEAKLYLKETLAKKEHTDQAGVKREITAGHKEREVHKNAVEKLKQAAMGIGADPANIKSTWLQDGDDDRSLEDFIKYPKKMLSDKTDAFNVMRGRLDNERDREKLDAILKSAKGGDEKSLQDLLKVAKGMLEDSKKDKEILSKPEGEKVRKEIEDKGIENIDVIYNAALHRDKIARDMGSGRSVVELKADETTGALKDLKLEDLIVKKERGYVIKSEMLVAKVLKRLGKSKKEFEKDLEEYNKVVGKKGFKEKEIDTLAPAEKVKVTVDVRDLQNELQNKYIEPLKNLADKEAEVVKRHIRIYKKSASRSGKSFLAQDLEKKGDAAEKREKKEKFVKAVKGEL